MEAVSDRLVGVNPDAAADSKPRKTSTWETNPVFKNADQLRRAVDEYNSSQGQSGSLATYLTLTWADSKAFSKAQGPLLWPITPTHPTQK